MRALVIFEDRAWSSLAPLTDVTPMHALAFGASTLAERWRLATRLELGFALSRFTSPPAARRARAAGGDLVFAANAAALPGRWVKQALASRRPALFTANGRIAAALVPSERLAKAADLERALLAMKLPEKTTDAAFLEHPWDLIARNAGAIAQDLAAAKARVRGRVHPRAVLVDRARITVAPGAIVDALAVLDASDGPIWIGPRARIRPHSLIEGPCAIGASTQVLGGRVARSTIGPECRVAGEVEDSILQGFSNKRHHGFVGHSVVGAWVNLGALTTTSDLKNNYGIVRVWAAGEERSSGSSKVGAFIGAHVKTGIGTLLPTGASVGTGANLFGGGTFAPKRVPPFGWWDGERMREHEFDKFLATARVVMSRRGETLTDSAAEALRHCFESSKRERRAR